MDANSALQQATGQSDNVGTLLQQEQTTLDPMQKNLSATMGKQPEQPKLQSAPDKPKDNMAEDATTWMATLNVLAGLGGARSRQGATAALTAFGGGVNSFKQGKLDQFKEHQDAWKDANQSVIENNKAQIDAYKSALTDKKMSVDEQMANIKIIASQYHNDIMSQLAEQRNFTAVARVMDMMQSNTDKLQLQYEKLHDQIGSAADQAKTAQDAASEWLDKYIDKTTKKPVAGAPPMGQYVQDAMKKAQGGGAGRDDAAREQDIEALHNGSTPQSLGYSMSRSGKPNPDWIATKDAWAKKYPKDDIAAIQLKYAGEKAGATSVGRTAAGTELASNILDESLPSMMDAAQKLGLSPSTSLNAVVNAAKRQLSSQDYANFSTQLRAVTTDYSQLIGRGRPTVHSDDEALKILSTDMGITSLQGFTDAVKTEEGNIKRGIQRTQGGGSSAQSGATHKYNPDTGQIE